MTVAAAPPLHTRARSPWYVLAGAIVLQGATAPGPLIVSLGVDLFGSYTPVLNALGLVALALAAATLFVEPPATPRSDLDRGDGVGGVR